MKNSVKAVIITGGLIMVLLIGLLVWAVAQRAESENDPKPQVLREESHVRRDQSEGTFLGVEGTPTFFVDGQMIAITEPGDLERAIVEAQSR
ncbi:hypothetical protein AB0N64_07475 [Microbacterium sp. NPDC089318]